MAIFANQSAIRFSSTPVDIIARRPIPDGALLVYDAKKGVFYTNSNTTSKPYIENARTTGSNNSKSIFKEKDETELVFKELESGNGISIDSTNDKITISSDISDSTPISETDYNIVIDSNNNEPNARFEITTGIASPSNPIEIYPQVSILTNEDVWVNNEINRGYIVSTGSNNFVGVIENGNFLEIKNSQDLNNDTINDIDGDYIVNDVVDFGPIIPTFPSPNQTIYVENIFSNSNNLPNYYNSVYLYKWDLYAPDTTTIESSFTDFGQILEIGMEITITGSHNGDFDGNYKIINSVSLSSATGIKSYIELSNKTPLPKTGIIKDTSPLTPQLKISVIEYTGNTGFYVTKNGDIHGNDLILNKDISANDGIFNDIQTNNIKNNSSITTNSLNVNNNINSNSLQVSNNIETNTLHSTSKITTNSIPNNLNDVTTKQWVENNTVEITNLTGAALLPRGNTAERPYPGIDGMIRYNTDTFKIEACAGGMWVNLT